MSETPAVRLDDETIHRLSGVLAQRVAGQVSGALLPALETLAASAAAPAAPARDPQPGEPGFDLWRDRKDNAMTQLIMQYALNAADSCIDVGANVGRVLEDIVRMAPHGRHLAFEPIPEHAAALQARFPQVDVHQAAVAEEAGESTFVLVPQATGYSGLRERGYPDEVTETREIVVALERLDDVVPADMAPRLIKIDVEGGELGVLRSGRETIARHRPIIVFEHGVTTSALYGTTPDLIYDVLAGDCGMRLYDLDGVGPFSRDQWVEIVSTSGRWCWVAHG